MGLLTVRYRGFSNPEFWSAFGRVLLGGVFGMAVEWLIYWQRPDRATPKQLDDAFWHSANAVSISIAVNEFFPHSEPREAAAVSFATEVAKGSATIVAERMQLWITGGSSDRTITSDLITVLAESAWAAAKTWATSQIFGHEEFRTFSPAAKQAFSTAIWGSVRALNENLRFAFR